MQLDNTCNSPTQADNLAATSCCKRSPGSDVDATIAPMCHWIAVMQVERHLLKRRKDGISVALRAVDIAGPWKVVALVRLGPSPYAAMNYIFVSAASLGQGFRRVRFCCVSRQQQQLRFRMTRSPSVNHTHLGCLGYAHATDVSTGSLVRTAHVCVRVAAAVCCPTGCVPHNQVPSVHHCLHNLHRAPQGAVGVLWPLNAHTG